MPEWNQAKYQGIDPGLLQQLVNMPSKNAAGINAFSQGAFGDSNQHGAMGAIQGMVQKNQQQQTLQKLMQQLQGQGQQPQGSVGSGFSAGQTQAPTNTISLGGAQYTNINGQWYQL
jgi:hypothetical protein